MALSPKDSSLSGKMLSRHSIPIILSFEEMAERLNATGSLYRVFFLAYILSA